VQRLIIYLLLAAVPGILSANSTARKPATARVKVPVLVPAGTDFNIEDVKATVNGGSAKVIAVAGPADDLILMLVLDLSDDLTLAQRANTALIQEIERLHPNVYIALLRAQDGLRVVQDPTLDRTVIRTAIESLTISGRAGLLDSIETAAGIGDAILARSAVRVAVIYITDSDVTNYRQDFTNPVINSSDSGDLSRKFPEALIQEHISKLDANLTRRFAPLFIVHTTYRSDRRNEAYLNGLLQLAATAGGSAIICRSNAEVPAAIKSVLDTIQNHYSVTLALPKGDGRPVDVRLAVGESEGTQNGLPHRVRFTLKKE
jgi:hypothetical protein